MSRRGLVFAWSSLVVLYAAPAAAVAPFVEGRWVERHLSDPRVALVDMSAEETQYQRFHLPGAVRLPYEALLKLRAVNGAGAGGSDPDKSPRPGAEAARIPVRLDDAELAGLLGRLGITREKYVIVYDDVAGIHAARLFWELERIGHPRVSILDGGLVKWILEGRKVVNNAPAPKPVVYELAGEGRANEAALADIKDALANRATLLLDTRSHEEYVGDPKKPRSGHIPGARLWPWEQGVDLARGFVRAEEATLRKSLAAVGVKSNKTPIITYCASGRRAAQVYATLRSLGFEDVRVYANSMNEYELDSGNPLKQGARP
jgi:thiosulfate/3-mercaptopyruvate sulfurtransferase